MHSVNAPLLSVVDGLPIGMLRLLNCNGSYCTNIYSDSNIIRHIEICNKRVQ